MRFAQVMLAGCALAGCATSKPYYDPVIPFDGQDVSAIRVQADGVPEKALALDQPINYSGISASAMNTYNPAVSAGAAAAGGIIAMLIIAGIDASVDGARNEKINKFLAEHKFDAKKVFHDALSAELGKAGYAVEGLGANAAAPSQALIMDIDLVYYGYSIVGPEWAPTVAATVMVKSADGATTLLDDALMMGAPPGYAAAAAAMPLYGVGGDTIILPYNPAHVLANEDAITLGDPAVSLAGLRFSLESVAKGVASLVRKEAPATPAPAVTPAGAAAAAAE